MEQPFAAGGWAEATGEALDPGGAAPLANLVDGFARSLSDHPIGLSLHVLYGFREGHGVPSRLREDLFLDFFETFRLFGRVVS
jgi:hypothetical protein